MSVKVLYTGRMGNNLFQYVFARLFAEKNGLKLSTEFPYQHLLKTTEPKHGREIKNNEIIIRNDSFMITPGSSHDYVITNKENRSIDGRVYSANQIMEKNFSDNACLIQGFFEDSDIFNSNERLIKSYFKLEKVEMNHEDIVLNVRLEDFAKLNRVLNPDYYINILENETFNKLYIVGANKEDSYLKHFEKYNPVIVPTDPNSDFHFIRSFKKVICCNSTFSWWAAFLSDSEKIYLPDMFISPDITSCKNNKCIYAEPLNDMNYSSITSYKSDCNYLNFSNKLKLKLSSYFNYERTEYKNGKAVIDCVNIIRKSLTKKEADAKDFILKIKITGFKIYNILCTKDENIFIDPSKPSDCTILVNKKVLFNFLMDPINYIQDSLVNISGDKKIFFKYFDLTKWIGCLKDIDYMRPIWFEGNILFLRIANRISGGHVVGFYEEVEENLESIKGNLLLMYSPYEDVSNNLKKMYGPFEICIRSEDTDLTTKKISEEFSNTISNLQKDNTQSQIKAISMTSNSKIYNILIAIKSMKNIPVIMVSRFNNSCLCNITLNEVLNLFYKDNIGSLFFNSGVEVMKEKILSSIK